MFGAMRKAAAAGALAVMMAAGAIAGVGGQAAVSTAEAAPARVTDRKPWKKEHIDGRCRTGWVICVSKKDRKVRLMHSGMIVSQLDARFGGKPNVTRNGVFTVTRKSRNHVSNLYHSKMPFALFFSGGQAIHYSSDFARRGYRGASHGCVNTRDYKLMERLYDRTSLGTKVVVS